MVTGIYNPIDQTYRLDTEQIIEKNTRGELQKPFFYPLAIAIFDPSGNRYPLNLEDNSLQNRILDGIIILSKEKESFLFQNINQNPKISLNRGFSAPIKVIFTETDPVFLMQHETDGFARYEATQQYAISVI